MGGKGGQKISREEAGCTLDQVISTISPLVEDYEICGSYRRGEEMVGDGDLVVLVPDDKVWGQVMELLGCDPLTQAGTLRKGVMVLVDGFQVDVSRARTSLEFSSMVLTATGSAEFNVACRWLAKTQGWKLNQYGMWSLGNGELVAWGEAAILEKLGIGYVPPQERTGWDAISR